MSILRLTEENFQSYILNSNPPREFSSSSLGTIGDVYLFTENTGSLKDVFLKNNSLHTDDQVELLRADIVANGISNSKLENLLSKINQTPKSERQSKKILVKKIFPGQKDDLNKDNLKKITIKNNLFKYYRNKYRHLNWAYTNYNTLNFVTGGDLPKDSVLIYPSPTNNSNAGLKNPFAPYNAFTFDFYLNPRYTITDVGQSFNAGTILHMSSCYAISLVTGSSVGIDGKPDAFRLLLQLSSSAEIPPSKLKITNNTITSYGGGDSQYCYISSDNSLKFNNWHHVAIKWDGNNYKSRNGNIVIDDKIDTQFIIQKSSIMQYTPPAGASYDDPNALFIGNFYEGTNSGNNKISYFFNSVASTEEGTTQLASYGNNPTTYTFNHPLNAEIHDLKIYKNFQTLQQTLTCSLYGDTLNDNLIFYVPPFFIKETRTRKIIEYLDSNTRTSVYAKTNLPFNPYLSFGLSTRKINLENFTQDFVSKEYPRLFNLTGTNYGANKVSNYTAIEQLYLTSSLKKANITILPCDNGRFLPNFDLLKNSSYDSSSFVNSLGDPAYSLINLDNLISTSSLLKLKSIEQYNIFMENNADLNNPIFTSSPKPKDCSVLNATQDPSSNEVTIFDISNLFYGDKIKPGTFTVQDLAVTGSSGRISFTLKDDQYGNLYRADSLTQNCKWSSVGNILYEEGLVVIKSPHMPYFGKDSYKISFSGERKIYVFEVSIPVPPGLFNSSSNPTYQDLIPSDYVNETSKKFTYITNLNLHDDNLNVIMKSNFSQPIIKKEREKFLIKVRVDF